LLKWLDIRGASKAGTELADQFPRAQVPVSGGRGKQERARQAYDEAMRRFLQRAVDEAGPLRLNFIKRAWFANSFKWRLVEIGIDSQTANEWTHLLVLAISSKGARKGAA
jgi:hypothetical protein